MAPIVLIAMMVAPAENIMLAVNYSGKTGRFCFRKR
jgi:hypothetical protein